LTRFVH